MSADSISIIFATLFGPVLAIIVSEIIRARSESRARKMHVFRTLMATRKVVISLEHVNALNLIEIEFQGSEPVVGAWQNYISHLNIDQPTSIDAWWRNKDKLLATLLHKMSIELGYDFDSMEIFQGGYAPTAWQTRDNLQVGALQFLDKLAKSEVSFPVQVKAN